MTVTPQLRISIVTPSLNQGRFIAEAVESVRVQSYPAHEHIINDGESADSTVKILQRVSADGSHGSIRWRSSGDRGQSDALNQGFAAASGDIIGWLNADDRYRPDCLRLVAEAFSRNPKTDVLYGDFTYISEDGKHLALRREIEFNRFVLRYHRVLYIPTTSTFFRKRVITDGNYLREDLHYAMDLEFFIRLAAAGYRFQHLPKVLADFRVHNASKSVQFAGKQSAEHRQVVLSGTSLRLLRQIPRAQNAAAHALQIAAGTIRYTEKLIRGFYFSSNGRRLITPSTTGEIS